MNDIFNNVIKNLDHQELMKIKKDLDQGAIETKKIILKQIKEKEKQHEKYCSVCASDIDPYTTSTYTLIFGPDGFKKKATFCAIDCMKYFIGRLEEANSLVKKNS